MESYQQVNRVLRAVISRPLQSQRSRQWMLRCRQVKSCLELGAVVLV